MAQAASPGSDPTPTPQNNLDAAQVALSTSHSWGSWCEQNTTELPCPGLCLLQTPPLSEEAAEFAVPPAWLEQGFSGSQTKAMEIVWGDKEGTV